MTIKMINNSIMLLKSSMKIKDIELVKRQASDNLVLKDEDGNEVFKVDIASSGDGSICNYGVSFAPVSAEGYATVTAKIPVCDDPKQYIVDTYGQALNKLSEIESNFSGAVSSVLADRAAIAELIVEAN